MADIPPHLAAHQCKQVARHLRGPVDEIGKPRMTRPDKAPKNPQSRRSRRCRSRPRGAPHGSHLLPPPRPSGRRLRTRIRAASARHEWPDPYRYGTVTQHHVFHLVLLRHGSLYHAEARRCLDPDQWPQEAPAIGLDVGNEETAMLRRMLLLATAGCLISMEIQPLAALAQQLQPVAPETSLGSIKQAITSATGYSAEIGRADSNIPATRGDHCEQQAHSCAKSREGERGGAYCRCGGYTRWPIDRS